MKEYELVSIIIPIYNIEGYLPNCLNSIGRQTYSNLEIILVDDGSTDRSREICDKYALSDSRTIVLHQKNLGIWAARNSGQRIARGQYVMFVDGDDYMHADTVKTLYQAITQNKADIAVVDFKQTETFNEDIYSEIVGREENITQKELVKRLFKGKVARQVWNKLYRKSLIENIYAHDYPRTQGYDYNIRAFMMAHSAVVVHCKMYFWVQRPTSFIHQANFWELAYPCMVKLLYNNYKHLPKDKACYSHFLLCALYRKMVFWKYGRWSSEEGIELCSQYEKLTRKAYWLNWRINPLEKIGVTILLHNPRLTRWLMKVTKNY